MASAFGHAAVALAIGKCFSKRLIHWPVLLTGVICCIIPDADVITFRFGIPYNSFWGHRGFSHSFLFAGIWGFACAFPFYLKSHRWKDLLLLWFYFFLCTASHPLLDAMTNGGFGVALFSPWDNTRYFLPWKPIAVSPIGAARFFSARGLEVLASEMLYIGVPSLMIWFLGYLLRKRN